jgi:ABC-type transport system substrate-binding protein/class 3 adenylate cyclase
VAEIRTFLIADVRGYTRFTQTHGDEAGARLAARFAVVVREQVEARGGRVVELRGDEALCVFGSPRSALRAAVDLQRRCADELRADPSLPLSVGVGIDAGEAVEVEGGYRGGPLNLAARLCSLAQRGEVLVSDVVMHLARRVEEVEYVDRGRMQMKGFEQPVHVFQARFELDLPEETELPKQKRVTVLRLAAAAVGLIAVAAGVVAVAATSGNGHPSVQLGTNVVGVLDGSGRVVGQVQLPGAPSGVAAGAGSVWATVGSADEVLRINPRARLVVAPLGTGSGSAPAGVAVGGDGVWVADSGTGRVSWINPAQPQNAPTQISVGQGPGPIAFGEGAAWVINTTDGTLQRIAATSLKPSTPIPVGVAPDAVTVGGGWVWVADSSSATVIKIDPKTLQVVARPSVGNDPVAVAFGGGHLWVANAADHTITRLDPQTGSGQPITVGGTPTGLAYGRGGVWVTLAGPSAVAHIDAQLKMSTTSVVSTPQSAATFGDETWVSALAPPATHRGGTLTVAFSTDQDFSPDHLDPAIGPYPEHWQELPMTHDGLLTYRKVGGPAGLQVVPDLAVAMPTVSDGGRTYTFQLRRGIRFSNGAPLRASDFASSIRREIALNVANGPMPYYQTLVFGSIEGVLACIQHSAKCSLAGGIHTDDTTGTITLHLTHPDPALPQKLATSFGMLVPSGSPAPDTRPAPGTGPYMVSKFDKNGGVVLVRNPYFHVWSASAQPAGYPDRIHYTWVPNPQKELAAVEQGKANVMVDGPPPSGLAGLATRYATLAHAHPPLAVEALWLNTRVPPFSSLQARKAVNFAVNRLTAATILGGPQVQVPTCQVLPPGMFGYRPYCPYTLNPTATGEWTAPDLARAKQLVKSSGTRGDRVVIWDWGGDGDRVVVPYLVGVLNSLGYDASQHITPNTFPQGYDQANLIPANSKNKVSAGMIGWQADYPNPADFLDVLLSCRAFLPRNPSNPNTSEFCDPTMDRLARRAEAVQERDPAQGARLWQTADRKAVDLAPWVPLIKPVSIDVLSSRTGNYQWNPQWSVLLDQLWVH